MQVVDPTSPTTTHKILKFFYYTIYMEKIIIIHTSDTTVPSMLAASVIKLHLSTTSPETNTIVVSSPCAIRALSGEEIYHLNHPDTGSEKKLYEIVWESFFENIPIPDINETKLNAYFPDVYAYLVTVTKEIV